MHAVGYVAQWLERLTADQQVPGSNPGVTCLSRGPDARPKLRGCYSRVPSLTIVATLTRHPVEKREQKSAFRRSCHEDRSVLGQDCALASPLGLMDKASDF